MKFLRCPHCDGMNVRYRGFTSYRNLRTMPVKVKKEDKLLEIGVWVECRDCEVEMEVLFKAHGDRTKTGWRDV